MGAGTETDDEVTVPKTIGVPMTPGMKLGMYVAWHNDTGKDLDGVFLKLTMLWTPKNQNPRPVNSHADLHGRQPDRRREQHVRRAPGQVVEVATSSPCRSAAGCSASAATCTTTASACGSRTRRPAR